MIRRAPLALLGLVAFVLVSGACRKSEPPPVALTPTTQGPLVFPPPLDGWTARAPLPAAATDPREAGVRLDAPHLDDKGHFETTGQVIRLQFDDVVVDDLKKAPTLTITPPVRGKTVWPYGSSVEFHADAPFDPHVDYTLTLPELVNAAGRKLVGGLRVAFRSKPALDVAGKTISYLPEQGRARPIATLPLDDGMIGGGQEITVVYDQPVDLALARKLVTLEDSDGKPIPSTLGHLPTDTFEGQKVDRRMILVLRPVQPLAPGKELVVRAAPQKDEDDVARRKLTVAAPTRLDAVDCGGRGAACEVDGTRVLAPSDASLRIRWTNPVSGFANDKRVHVSPPAKSTYVYGYDNEVNIHASFEPSRTYTVRVDGGRDDYGGYVPPLSVTFETRPLPASVTMAEGPLLLDESALRAFPVTLRNVERGEVRLWPLAPGDVESFKKAMREVRSGAVPAGSPLVFPFTASGRRDAFTDALVDLSGRAELGRVYVANVSATQVTPKALAPGEARKGSREDSARQDVTSLLVTAAPGAVGAHVHQVGGKAVFQVYGLASGEPVGGAKVTVGPASATTDGNGSATLDVPAPVAADELVAVVSANGNDVIIPFGAAHASTSGTLFPDLARARPAEHEGRDAPAASTTGDLVGMIVTDRGVYKPGTKIALKGFVRRIDGAGVRPAPGAKVRLHVLDATEQQILDQPLTTGERGTFAKDIALPKDAHTGRWHVRIEVDGDTRTVLADETVRVAAFEAPRFKVDVTETGGAADRMAAKVTARYLFGAPMSGATVSWVMKKRRVPVNGGPLGDAGLSFDDDASWWGGEPDPEELRPVAGEAKLDAEGTFALDVPTGPLSTRGPTEVALEADVTDASSRHVMGSLRTVKDPIARHAGLRLSRRFGDLGPLRVELGAVDAKGNALVGEKVTARLERLTWTRSAEKAESGAIVERWKDVATAAGTCEVTSAAKPATCELPVEREGSYRVTARVGDTDGGRASFYAWGSNGARSPGDAVPSSGKKLPLVLDRARYKAGETAVVLVQSPYASATALLTVEQGGLLRTETKRVDGPSGTFAIPVSATNAPWLHAVVTLLPIGATEADYRVGVARIPVADDDARLDVKVASARPSYQVREEAAITVEVKRNGAPVKNADVTLAVVDEGVLRLTNHHAKDPVPALHPGRDLAFRLVDSRGWLVRRRERAHVAGGGDSEGADELDTRKNFVETAAFLTDLVTDAQGRVTAKVPLPDNLTEFRMMAVAVDDIGAGGNAEGSFLVTKPVLLDPVMPRFALRGDAFEAAAIVHNTTDAPVVAKVTVAGEVRDVTVPARGRSRVGVPMKADKAGTRKMLFAVEALGAVRDRVELPLRIDEPGVDEHPALSGVFLDKREIGLAVPADAIFEDGAALSVKTGSALYPELGHRLGYLLDYPHGCVEQTASSTIPLLAARTLLPWTGTSPLSDEEIARRVRIGVDRLATMKTSTGGLAYWPGGREPSTFGSAYALRVLVRAKAMGIEHPNLVDQITTYLTSALDEVDATTRVAIAEALAIAEKLPPSAADALWDKRDKLDTFGTASLAIALGSLPQQEDRVRELVDTVEASFDDKGEPTKKATSQDWHGWGADDRARAQALITLLRHRKESKLVPLLAERLARGVEGYTTQSTAWSLLALADHIGSKKPEGGVDVKLRLEGRILDTTRKLGGDNKEVRIPLRELAGKKLTLLLQGDGKIPSAFALEATYKRPLGAQDGRLGRRSAKGASIHRVYSDAAGKPLDLAQVKTGQVIRVALRIELPDVGDHAAYLAVTDRIPAGFEPIDPELSTSSVPDVTKEHPFHDGFRRHYEGPSHVDLRDDRVQIYFDRIWSGPTLYVSYVARATTPGTFALPPAHGERMYEPGSDGYSDAAQVTIAP